MFGRQFYHESLRKIVVAFGTIFNNIVIVRQDSDGGTIQRLKVPLAYSPKEKFLTRLEQQPNLDQREMAISLPRMGFEISGLSYDSSRKLQRVGKFKNVNTSDAGKQYYQYNPVPYNLSFNLYSFTATAEDGLCIVEQILPYFQPDYTVTINDMTDMGIKRDVPIVLGSVSYEDNYQGNFEERRAIIYTLTFTAKFYLYGPVTSDKVIKTVQVDQYADSQINAPSREQRYTVTPNPASADADDDFGFNETSSFYEDAKNFDSECGCDM